MKKISKFWWVFCIINIILNFVNPYIGVFSLVNVIELFLFSILKIIISSILKQREYLGDDDPSVRLNISGLKPAIYFSSIFTLIFKTFAINLIFFVGYTLPKTASLVILYNSNSIALISLIFTNILNVLISISYIIHQKNKI